ncbi:hypothetical protein NB037_16845 [Rathayibacter sp. ZW T2_19]|uniref:Uncharacterized protein n=1 Tax=Rathayibacter rubneri TaxID=2950106 RepID=A0A9X2IVY3_9MICO|nr:hypothetical protein [Rathayibacter rubneri]MCM6764084.1 hypothetical protein [Rathayibacter rubneri]
MRAQRSRKRGLAALALTAVLLLAGCSGDSFRADFARTFGSDEAVADLELSTVDDMPFTGGVSAEVVAREDLDEAGLQALAGRLSAFASQRPVGDVRVVLDAEGLSLPVSGDPDLTDGRIAAALELRDDARVSSVALTADDSDDRVSGLSLFLSDRATAEDLFALARNTPDLLPDAAPVHVSVQSSDRSALVSGDPGEWIGAAEGTWAAVSTVVPASGFRAVPERLEVTLADEDDLAAAESASAASGGPAVAFSSPLVALGDSGTGVAARVVLAALAPEILADVRSVWTDDDRLRLAVDSADRAAAVAEAVSATPGSAEFATLAITVGEGPTLEVSAAPRSFGAAVADASALLATPGVTAVARSDRSVTVTAAGDDGDLGRLLPPARSLAAEGARICIQRADGTGVCDTSTG